MVEAWEALAKKSEKEENIPVIPASLSPSDIISQTDISDFKLEEAVLTPKIVVTIYGSKGSGKTTLAEGFPGTVAVLSFDRKSVAPKINYYNNDSRIKVFDAVKYYNRDTKLVRESAVKTYAYITFLLKELAKNPPDWVVIDGIEIMQKVAEMVMRQRNNLLPYQGVANLNVWKERNAIIDEIHQLALNTAKKGVIYTTYCDYDEIVEEGSLVTKEKVPRYIDSVMWETDIVLYIESKFDPETKKYNVKIRCDTSKFDNIIKSGSIFDITGKTIRDVLNLDSFFKSEGGNQK